MGKRSSFGWDYPPGSGSDPFAPWNDDDNGEEICLRCGKRTVDTYNRYYCEYVCDYCNDEINSEEAENGEE